MVTITAQTIINTLRAAAIAKAQANYAHDQAAAMALWKTERGIVEAAQWGGS